MKPFFVLHDTAAGPRRYILRAWIVAAVPALALLAGRMVLGLATWDLPPRPDLQALEAYSVLGAPLVETALMFPLALALDRLPGTGDFPRVLALAAIAALAHAFGGSAWQVANAFWPFVVYAAALFAWRRRSAAAAFLVTAAIHALYNATFVVVGHLGQLLADG